MQKTLVLICIFTFLAIYHGKAFNFGVNDFINSNPSFESFRSESKNLKALFSPFPKLIHISDALSRIGRLSEELLVIHRDVHNASYQLWITSRPDLNDQTMKEKIENFAPVFYNFADSYLRIKEEIDQISLSQFLEDIQKDEINLDSKAKLFERGMILVYFISVFRNFIGLQIHNLNTQISAIHTYFIYKSLPDLGDLGKLRLLDADFFWFCDTLDCYKRFYQKCFQNQEFDNSINKLMLLSLLFEKVADVSSISADEKGDQFKRALQQGSNELDQVKLFLEEALRIQIIMINLISEKAQDYVRENYMKVVVDFEMIFHLVQQDLPELYERFIWKILQERQKSIVE